MNTENRLATIEARLADLEEENDELRTALRNSRATLEALKAMTLTLITLNPAPKAVALRAATIALDAANAGMDEAGNDPEYQRAVREALERLLAAYAGAAPAAHNRTPRPTSPPDE